MKKSKKLRKKQNNNSRKPTTKTNKQEKKINNNNVYKNNKTEKIAYNGYVIEQNVELARTVRHALLDQLADLQPQKQKKKKAQK